MLIEIKTAFLFYIFIVLAGTIVLTNLWYTHRKKYNGLHYFCYSFIAQAIALLLVVFRGDIPDFFSIVVANLSSIWGVAMLYFGLSYFIGQKPKIALSMYLMALFSLLLVYHTYVHPKVQFRMIEFSIILIAFSFMSIWFLSRNTNSFFKDLTYNIRILLWGYILLNLIRIIHLQINNKDFQSYFDSGSIETITVIVYSVLSVFLSYSLVIAVNKRLIEEIKIQDEKFLKAFHHAPNAIILTRFQDSIVYDVNDSFTKITGYKKEEIVGKTTINMNLWKTPGQRKKLIADLIELGEIQNMELQFKRKDGKIFEGILHASIINTAVEKFILSTVQDISEEKELIKKLQQTTQELTESNRAKDKLFSIIAHDLKSPFSNVVALSEILKQQIDEGDFSMLNKHAGAIESSAKRATDLLLNLLEWSRIQVGSLVLNTSSILPQTILNETLELLKVNADKKSIHVSVQSEINYPIMVDKNIMSTVLRNLLSNAIKFTPKGGNISLKLEDTENESIWIVEDNGVGIPPEKIPLLFDISEKTSTLGTELEKGTGLGLPICKELITKHGGSIVVISDANKGSSFICKLPKTISA